MSESEILAKFGRALTHVGSVTKSAEVKTGSYSYKYTTLPQVLRVVRAALETEGLAMAMPLTTGDGQATIEILLIDGDGEVLRFAGYGFPIGKDPQANGSAITYGKRYSLVSLFCIEESDDDGQSASDAIAKQDEPHPLSERVTKVQGEMRSLSKDEQHAMRDWADDRPLNAPAMLDDETWLAHVESWLDEMGNR